MARSLGATLPLDLLETLSQSDLSSRLHRALSVVTVDSASRPHPMLCSYMEVLAVDPSTIRLAIAATSSSATNLEERRAATLILVDPERTAYVKCRATGAPLTLGGLKRFVLNVEEVLEDAADPAEGPVRITSGITYRPAPSIDDSRVRVTLDALRRD